MRKIPFTLVAMATVCLAFVSCSRELKPSKKGGYLVSNKKLIEVAAVAVETAFTPEGFALNYFNGEPGGGLLMDLSNLVWEGSLPARLRRADKFLIKLKADVASHPTKDSGATLSNGKIEIERDITVGLKETITTASGPYKAAVAVWMVTSGRAAVGPDLDKNVEIPIGENGILWFEDRVGLVQSKNRSGQWFQLVEKKLN